MQVYTELIPPTAVTHAVALPFTQSQELELAVAKTNLLQIFRVIETQRHIPHQVNGHAQESANAQEEHGRRLCLVGEYELSGTITSLARIKTLNTRTGGEALLISFRDAKASLVEWHPEVHALSTISVHLYEQDDLTGSPWSPDLRDSPSYIVTNPNSRCAALRFGVRHLAIIPFRQPADDLTLGDFDAALDEAPTTNGKTNGTAAVDNGAPYASSFVLLLTELDPAVIHVEDLAFLYEYRDPTLGVLSTSRAPAVSIAPDRKDCLTYTVFTLDLHQRASTALISATDLPSDLFKVVPLPLPVGGTLLIGGNELIHVDQSGKTLAVAVNEFATQASGLSMTDQSSLGLRLEGSYIVQRSNNGEVLLVLNNGQLISLKFRVDGRTVSGFTVHIVPASKGGTLLGAPASCATTLGHDIIFVGSEEADAVLVHTTQRRAALSKKRSHAEMLGATEDGVSDEEAEDDDDLYGDAASLTRAVSQTPITGRMQDEAQYSVLDRLPNLTSSGEPVFGKRRKLSPSETPARDKLDLAMAAGCGTASSIAFLSRDISFHQIRELPLSSAERIWALASKRPESTTDPNSSDHNIVIAAGADGSSKMYRVTGEDIEERLESDFEASVTTLDAGLVCGGTKVVQISPSEVRCYSLDFSYPQIFPMMDDSGESELKATASSISDPYVLLIRDDGSCIILKADAKGELDEMEHGEVLRDTKWASGSLYRPHNDAGPTMAFMLSIEGALHIFELPNTDAPAFSIENLGLLPPYIGPDSHFRRSANREKLVEVVAAELGPTDASSLHLIIRTEQDGIAIYKPYHYPSKSESSFTMNLRWFKVADSPGDESLVDMNDEDDDEEGEAAPSRKAMKALPDLGGYSTIFVPCRAPALIMKEPCGSPHLLKLHSGADVDLASFSGLGCTNGALQITRQNVQLVQTPTDTTYSVGWAVRRAAQHQHVETLCYHEASDMYIVCVNEPADFRLPEDDDWHPDWAKEDIAMKPQIAAGKVRLVHGASGATVHELPVEDDEVILSAKVIELETSENTHERKAMIVVGTAIMRGEDQPSNGGIYVFDVIQVVPDPERPVSDRALRLVCRDEVKGAVTSLSEIGAEGFLLAAQGQKLMVRGLKEDDTLLPVAFMDVQVQVTALKNVKGTGMALMADAMKGIWLLGYTPEPHRMRMFGKSRSAMQVAAAELLPYQKQLFAIVVDTECNLHVFEYNPEDPKSLSGQRLLNRSTFHTGNFPSSMISIPTSISKLIPETDGDELTNGDSHTATDSTTSIIVPMQSGTIALVSPMDEAAYRRLGALQIHLNSILDHTCGLNPRSYRAVESEAFGGRGILDGQILKRWHMLSAPRKAEAAARVGSSVWEIRADLAVIAGEGLVYF